MNKQSGVALISALLVFALLVILLGRILLETQTSIERTSWVSQQAQADAYAMSGEQYALDRLHQALITETPLGEESLLYTLLDAPVSFPDEENLSIETRIWDMQGYININSLAGQPAFSSLFSEIFSRNGWPLDTLEAINDWSDADSLPQGTGGAEDYFYQSQPTPYRAANQLTADKSEWLLVKGIHTDIYQKLEPALVSLPGATRININTAPAEVFDLIHPDLSGAQIVSYRDGQSQRFKDVATFMQSSWTAGIPLDASLFTTRSSYYRLQTRVSLADISVNLISDYAYDQTTGSLHRLRRIFGNDLR